MYDAIVVGAGPGGTTASMLMARKGLRPLVLDRETFPRDKICGDAVGGKSMDALRELGLDVAVQQAESLGSWGVTFSGPFGDSVSIPFRKMIDGPVAPGYICAREVFDDVLFQAALSEGVEIRQGVTVRSLLREGERVVGVSCQDADGRTFEERAPIVIGADGAYSTVARELGMDQLDERHYIAAVRAYYEGVTGFTDDHQVELHFVDEAIPGYFWIFPMAGGRANVGVGMLSREVKKRGVRLKPLLEQLTQHPRFAERFRDARLVGRVKGWGLPVGSRPRKMAGDGWMLLGDAASLIDPFTGEGIGNAMVSGMKAADWTIRSRDTGNVSGAFLAGYEREVLDILRSELRLSHMMQRLTRWKWLLNTVIRKASRSPELANAISCMFDDLGERQKLTSPMFYLRVLAA